MEPPKIVELLVVTVLTSLQEGSQRWTKSLPPVGLVHSVRLNLLVDLVQNGQSLGDVLLAIYFTRSSHDGGWLRLGS